MHHHARIILATGAGALFLTGLVGVLHLPFATSLLRKISPASLCPITHGSAAQIDRAHAIGGAAIRASATTTAPSRPALGFELDKTTRADLDAWAEKHGLSCTSIGGNESLRRCADVPASAVGEADGLGMLEEVSFELRSSGELVDVETLRRQLTPERAAVVASELEATAATTLGAPTQSGGEAKSVHLAHGFLSSYVAEHTYSDYRATVSATNMGKPGVMVREQYLSVRP
jgi:hypothetical protein